MEILRCPQHFLLPLLWVVAILVLATQAEEEVASEEDSLSKQRRSANPKQRAYAGLRTQGYSSGLSSYGMQGYLMGGYPYGVQNQFIAGYPYGLQSTIMEGYPYGMQSQLIGGYPYGMQSQFKGGYPYGMQSQFIGGYPYGMNYFGGKYPMVYRNYYKGSYLG